MGYAETVMLLRDAESETEIVMERTDYDGDVLELRVTLGYGTPTSARTGIVRLPRKHFDVLAEWIANHADALRNAQWAAENAPREEEADDE